MSDEKKELRAAATQRRKEAFDLHGEGASRKLAAHGLNFLNLAPSAIVSGFLAIREEINPEPLMADLHAKGHKLALPVMEGKGLPLIMRLWAPGDEMMTVKWGIVEPLPDKPAVDPDVLIVPLLAFDKRGYRLGYGGGFYDRTLARLRVVKPVITVGVAYDEQEVDVVPTDVYDQQLDWMLTPSGPKRFGEA